MDGFRIPVVRFLLLFFFLLIPAAVPAQQGVNLKEELINIPTYPVGPPEPNPMFYFGRTYQGAKGPVYPYPMMDRLSETKQDRNYRALSLENEYVKFSILPELGGRIFSGLDKTNQYNFIYQQHVIKPALIGMLGAWISGGIEWNIPHHHRASTFMTVDSKMVENPDGSKTIWLGEFERRHRMRWLVGLTLRPGKSYLEATIKLINRTPVPNSMLYFANVAVHSNAQYQVLFPPDTQFGTQHAKREFVHWPIGQEKYAGVDYTGVDLSWWKNHPRPVSIFAWNYWSDFFGGYDHDKQAGICLYSDHAIAPGKKFFEFANGPEGFMWDKILTDTDGPYLELMAGAYSDNQPDYSWVMPNEVKTIRQFFYPIRELGGIKKANLDAALNLEIKGGQEARLALNTTAVFPSSRVQLWNQGKIQWEGTIDISPDRPFVKEIPLPASTTIQDLRAVLISRGGQELISYQSLPLKKEPLPQAVVPPPLPKDIPTVEELYLAGLRLEQFYNPSREPYPYYEEALRRDPLDSRTNTALGILYLKRGMYPEAEAHFRKALVRITRNYTSPKDGEPFYYLGIVCKAQGKLEEALPALQKAAWSSAWYAASNLAMSEISCRQKNYSRALELVEQSLMSNTQNTKALDLKATLQRLTGQMESAGKTAARALELDPLDFWASREMVLASGGLQQGDQAWKLDQEFEKSLRNDVNSYLELAADYGNIGFWEEATAVLNRLMTVSPDKTKINPLVHYDLGYYWNRQGDSVKAREHYRLASQMPPDYCFPFQLESMDILGEAMNINPQDARAPYYLGNLLFDLQPQKAIQYWEKSRALDSAFPIVHRNLGLGYWRIQNDVGKGIESMERAQAANPQDPRYSLELDQLYEAGKKPLQMRLAALEKNHEVVTRRDDALQREIALLILMGRYDRAIEMLSQRHFHLWEGGDDEASNVHNLYLAAHLQRGQQRFTKGEYQSALKDYEAALEYPDQLEIGRPYGGGRELMVLYFIGTAHKALGEQSKALDCFKKVVSKPGGEEDLKYYQGLAYQSLGKSQEANRLFDELITSGKKKLEAESNVDFFAKFSSRQSEAVQKAEAHYLIALGQLGKGARTLALQELEQTLRLDLNHWGAQNLMVLLH
jgi:tetratricopeptide (TPR) repeat protein